MSSRELTVLGTASQAPTRLRNHNGYVVRMDEDVTLFDPGEGTQRQLLLAGVPVSSLRRICITHFHGDHCLGLPGVLQRLSLDRVPGPVPVLFPAEGTAFFDRLRRASAYDDHTEVVPVPVEAPTDGRLVDVARSERPALTVRAARLRHRVPTVGWRLEEPSGRTMVPARLAEAGVFGPAVGRLQREGVAAVAGREVRLEDVSVPRHGQVVAVVMDTAWCESALALAEGADLLVCEATFDDAESELAAAVGHLTARQAGRLAREAGARRLVLTHFSQRYTDVAPLVAQAAQEHDGDVVAAQDLQRVAVPRRRSAPTGSSLRTPAPPPRRPREPQ